MLQSLPNLPTPQLAVQNAPSGAKPIVVPVILQYWQVVQRWRYVIIGIIAGALVVGLLATLLMTRQYTAVSRIDIARDQKNITNVQGLESNDANRDIEFYQTQYSLLEARSLAERVSRSLNLANNDDFFAAHGAKVGQGLFSDQKVAVTASERNARVALATDILLKHISVRPVRGSSLVDITYTSASPQVSQQVANAWVNQFMTSSMDRRFSSTVDARRFLEGRLADLRQRLEQSERDLVNYATAKGIVTLSRTQGVDGRTQSERTLVQANLEALNTALADATAQRIAAESRTQGGVGGGVTGDAVTSPAVSELRQRRAEVAADYAKLLVQFDPGYPAARALMEQIKSLDSAISKEERRLSSSRSTEYSQALQREQDLQLQVNQLRDQLSTQQTSSIQYNIYQREADTNRQLYDALLQRYKEIGVAGVAANNISVIDKAKLPDSPSSPRLLLNMALALIAGIGLAAITTFALEQIDEGVRDPTQVSRLLNFPLLGSVPESKEGNVLDHLRDTKSDIAEAYLSVRSNLAFSTDHGVPRSMMLTSTRPGEGKSTTSLALAIVLGRTGKSVLLIDADMRSPSMDHYLGVSNTAGLSNYLAGENDWRGLFQDTSERGVTLLVAGPAPPSAAELLSSDRMSQLIHQAVQEFDHVVVDTPPILGLADAPLLARVVEGCIFVTEAEGVAVRGIRASLARLEAVNAHIFGVVLTKLRRRQASYGYGYGYGYKYGTDDSKA